jgi:cytochrome subunit of sulfide dehydrogenase
VSGSRRFLSFALALLMWPMIASAQEMPAMVPVCALCHGETGPSPFSGVPTIHGLPHGVIENALFNFRYGHRPCRKSACSEDGRCPDMNMCDIAAPMSHDDRDALAAWYAAQPFAMHEDPYDAELAERGRQIHEAHCEICHTRYGSDPIDDASMLRGQRKVYLRAALEDFREGRRSVGLAAMDGRIRTFSDEELDALAEFFSGSAVKQLPSR